MRWLVLPLSKSTAIGNGLTYRSDDPRVQPGVLVRMKLRGKATEGIVVAADQESTLEESKILPIDDVEHKLPLLPKHSLETMRWVADYYRTTQRQALTVFLPPSPWHRVFLNMKEEQVPADPLPDGVTLNAEQLAAVRAIRDEGSKRPTLLFGVAGSGKTEVYAELVRSQLAKGKQSIVLVPEIFLAEHIVERLLQRLPREQTVVLHSQLSPVERRKAWMKVRTGEARVVIGPRSALFAPCQDLGLVIMDEEHEWTYKNEQTPRYHARETAETLCRYAGATLVLGTATPSLESWDRVERGSYTMQRLTERYGGAVFPTVQIVDLADVDGAQYPCSTPLILAMKERLEKHEQTVLFLNRRGLSSGVLCLDCRKRLLSTSSNLPYAVHRDASGRSYLLDHLTNQRADLPARCPHCGSVRLHPVGAGTQKLEDVIRRFFPDARVARADTDALTSIADMRALLKKLEAGDIDILLGTQMVAKGLDLPNVTLAAVLVADVGLSLPHFRSGERTFQLLAQLTGRSGRRNPGDVIIQTYRPDAPEVKAAATHDTEGYLRSERDIRAMLGYPPATDMIRFIVRAPGAHEAARRLQTALATRIENERIAASVTASPTFYGSGNEWHVILKGTNLRPLLETIDVPEHASIDVDPMDLL